MKNEEVNIIRDELIAELFCGVDFDYAKRIEGQLYEELTDILIFDLQTELNNGLDIEIYRIFHTQGTGI